MIRFHKEIPFTLKNTRKIKLWLTQSISALHKEAGEIHYIFCSDHYLLGLNQKFLNHDTYTDIITFDYTHNETLSADIYISIERVKENAKTFNSSFSNELHRVMIHGVLHLTGYKDKSKKDAQIMRNMEEQYLSLRSF